MKPHIHICIPCYGGLISESTFSSVLQFTILANSIGLMWTLDTLSNESLVTRARNNMVAKMMSNEKATHLMFIDADIRFPAESIISLLNANKPIVAGAYPKKSLPIDYAINKKPGGEVHGSLVEVITAATGFMMIERSVLTDMMVAYPKTKYCDSVGFGGQYEPYMFALFDTAIDSESHYLSEDWTFCRRWIDLQGQIFIDTNIKLDHIGSYSYAGALDQLRK